MRKRREQTRRLFVRPSHFKLALALFACLACPLCCAAQQRISGTVTDTHTHSPVKSATVKLEGGLFTLPTETATDADGRFSFAGLSPNRYTVRVSGYFSYTAQRAFQTAPASGGFTIEEAAQGTRTAAAFDQIHTAVGGLTWRERRSGFYATAALETGSGTPAALRDEDGEERVVRLPAHAVANFYFGVELFRHERRGLGLQFNVENATDRVYAIAKESEFTPMQFSPPRFLSGSMRVRF